MEYFLNKTAVTSFPPWLRSEKDRRRGRERAREKERMKEREKEKKREKGRKRQRLHSSSFSLTCVYQYEVH